MSLGIDSVLIEINLGIKKVALRKQPFLFYSNKKRLLQQLK